MTKIESCEEALKNLFAYLDQELEEHDREAMDAHLHDCRSCYSRAEFEKRLKTRLAQSGSEAPPVELRERIRKILKQF
ncbi:MAG: anti-sigma factor family protein [Burkholderiales bacterium]